MTQAKNYWVWQKPEFGKWRVTDEKLVYHSEKAAVVLSRVKELSLQLGKHRSIQIESEIAIEESVRTSEIEGKVLDRESVRSAILKKLGDDNANLLKNTCDVDGLIESLYDSIVNHNQPLTHERLHRWQASLFPSGRDERGYPVKCGAYREDPIRVITQAGNKPEKLHYVAPDAKDVKALMHDFIEWFNDTRDAPSLVRAALAVFWFVSIHPYEDGNGRLCRLIGDLAIAQSQDLEKRLFSISNVLATSKQRLDQYYSCLEACQRCEESIDIWVEFFTGCVFDAGTYALDVVNKQITVTRFWIKINEIGINDRQKAFFTKFLQKTERPFDALINNKKYQKITGTTAPATSKRDIKDLLDKGIILKAEGHEGRNTAYLANIEYSAKTEH